MLELNRKNLRLLSMMGMRGACGFALSELGDADKSLLCISADLCTTSGLDRFKEKHPEQMLNAGIAEQNMTGMAAGLAMEGFEVFTSTFATFASMRSVEQVRTLLAYMNLNVKVIGMAAGFSMQLFGNTHYSMEDIAIMRSIPGLRIYSLADATQTYMLVHELHHIAGPCYIRLTGGGNIPCIYKENWSFQWEKADVLMDGTEVAIIATGAILAEALKAAADLDKDNISCTVVNMHTIKPLDTATLDSLCESHKLLVTVEEHSVIGGLGGAIAEHIAKRSNSPRLEIIGIRDMYPKAGDYPYLLEQCGLTAQQIAARIRAIASKM